MAFRERVVPSTLRNPLPDARSNARFAEKTFRGGAHTYDRTVKSYDTSASSNYRDTIFVEARREIGTHISVSASDYALIKPRSNETWVESRNGSLRFYDIHVQQEREITSKRSTSLISDAAD